MEFQPCATENYILRIVTTIKIIECSHHTTGTGVGEFLIKKSCENFTRFNLIGQYDMCLVNKPPFDLNTHSGQF